MFYSLFVSRNTFSYCWRKSIPPTSTFTIREKPISRNVLSSTIVAQRGFENC